jgi:hypothetical protein
MSSSSRYCKVCFDAGKPEAEYLSHYVKDIAGSKGKVVCPTLLGMECTYCHMKGHMKSYCVILKKNVLARKKENSRAAHEFSANMQPKKENTQSISNVFGSLCCASDSDSDSDVVDDFPALCSKKENVCAKKKSSYATMVQVLEVDAVLEKKKRSWVEMNECDSDEDW